MKKVLVLALSVLTVIFMTTAVMAAEVTYEGKVSVKWNNDAALEEDNTGFAQEALEARFNIDYLKDFGEGITGGVKVIVEAGKTTEFPADADTDPESTDPFDVQNADAIKFDGAGWIKFDYDLFDVKVATSVDGNALNDLGAEFGLSGDPGVEVVAAPVDGLSLTGVVNDGWGDYRFLVKGEYVLDALTVGGGYQKENGDGVNADGDPLAKTAMGGYASYKVMDSLTVKGEYGSRNLGAAEDEEAVTAILVGAKYDDGTLSVDGSYLMKDAGYVLQNSDDADEFLARDAVKLNPLYDSSVVFVDASYALSDALTLDGSFDYIVSAKNAVTEEDYDFDVYNDQMSYKVGVTNAFTDKLSVEGWYKGYGKFENDDPHSQLGAKATYTFVDGVEGSFELTNGRASDDAEPVTKYTAMITATL